MKRNSPHQLPCLWLMLWPRLRSESRQSGWERRGQRASQRALQHMPRGCPERSQALTNSSSGRLALLLSLCAPELGVSAQRDSATCPGLHSQTWGARFYPGSFGPQACISPRLLQAVWPRLSSPRTLLSGDGPSQPFQPVRESQSPLTRGRTRAQPCLRDFTYENS